MPAPATFIPDNAPATFVPDEETPASDSLKGTFPTIQPNQYEKNQLMSFAAGRGKGESGMESGTELTTALATGIPRDIGRLKSAAGDALTAVVDAPPNIYNRLKGLSPGDRGFVAPIGKELLSDAATAATKPFVPIPKFESKPDDSFLMGASKEAANLLIGIPEFMETPLGAATLGTGAAIRGSGALIRRAFAADMMKSMAEQAPDIYSNWDKMTPGEKGKAITGFLGTGAMAALLTKPEFKGGKAKGEPIQGPPATGESLKLTEAELPPILPDMESARRVVEMTPQQFKKYAKSFNGTNLELGKNVTPEDVTELEKLSAKASERAKAAEDKYSKSGLAEDANNFMLLSQMPQFYNEAIRVAKEKAPQETPPPAPAPVAESGKAEATPEDQPLHDAFTKQHGRPPTPEEVAQIKSGSIELGQPETVPPEVPAPAIVSMGGMATADPLETAGKEGGKPDAYGIAERVREQRAKAGQVDPVEPGKGTNPPDSVEHGRALKAKGADPEASMSEFEKTKKLSSDDMALARAHGEDLARIARRTEEKFGTNSPEYQAAKKALSDWDKRSKAMQTEWHKTGMAQQGETDIDTGTFTGMERAYRDATDKEFTPDQAETAKKRAKKVREAVTDSEVAKQKLLKHVAETDARTESEKRAFDAANKTVREAAARLAEAERKARAIDAEKDLAVKKIQEEAAKRAADAASKTVRENEIRLARKEVVKRVQAAAKEKFAAERERAEAKKAIDKANESLRKAAIESARQVTKDRVAKADTSKYVWSKAREYIEKGMDDFDDIRTKLATDLGMTVKQVTEALAKDKKTKFLADDLWKKQQVARRLDQQAKRWLRDTTLPGYRRALESVPKILFSLKVGFHGTVALGTHAPMVAFQPRFWSTYVRDFGKMYRMVGSRAYYEMQVQDLLRRENYTTARRAGLVNDPFVFEDYNSPDVAKYCAGLTGMGNRGYAVLKILRQDMFDQHWNQLPKTARVAEVAKAIADGVNHATGVVKVQAPKGANLALFAPRLEASRVAWLAVDPAKAMATFLDWKNASEGDRHFAMQQVKEKAWVAGTMFSLLALNQGFLSATGSKQKINGLPQSLGGKGFDPMESDFLKFKAAGMDVSYGNAMLAMARLPVRLAAAIMYEGKMSKIVLEDERVAKIVFDYVRSQMSPFAGTATDLALGRDFAGRPLPRAGFGILPGRKDIPKRLKKHGVNTPYSWAEYSSEQFSPIPVSEGIKEVWGHGGLGMSDAQIKATLKTWGVTMIMMGTGGRLNEDWTLKK